jgi:hypothetical protein
MNGVVMFDVMLAVSLCLAVGVVLWTAVAIERHLLP